MKMLKAVMIGAAHVHVLEICKYVSECPDMELAGIADTPPLHASDLEGDKPYSRRWNLEYVRRYGVRVYSDWVEMLRTLQPDLAFITTENQMHVEVFRTCAELGVTAVIEKPMACNYEQALEIARISRRTGTEVFINWPIAWRPWLYQMKEVLDSGRMGRLIKVRHMAGQTGPVGPGAVHRGTDGHQAEEMSSAEKAKMWWYQQDCGGGAFLDMCCYGSMMSTWLCAAPCQAVAAMQGCFVHDWSDIADNGMMLLRFPGAAAVVEGTWTTPGAAILPGPEIFCRSGVISCERRGDAVVVKLTDLYGNVEYLEPQAADAGRKNIACAFSQYRLNGREMPEMTRLDLNLQAIAIVDAGLRAARSGKTEAVDDAVWGGR